MDDDRWRVIAEARATLQRLDEAERRRRFETSAREDIVGEDPLQRWQRLKQQSAEPVKPAPRQPAPPKPQPRNTAMNPDEVRKHVADRLVEFAADIGAEVGRADRALQDQIAALRAELQELRAELQSRAERSGEILLPDEWRAHAH